MEAREHGSFDIESPSQYINIKHVVDNVKTTYEKFWAGTRARNAKNVLDDIINNRWMPDFVSVMLIKNTYDVFIGSDHHTRFTRPYYTIIARADYEENVTVPCDEHRDFLGYC